MKYISFITDNCRETAKRYGLLSEIEGLAKKIEQDQSVQCWNMFPTPYMSKGLGRSFRIVSAKQPFDEETIVISFLQCFARGGDGEYDRFCRNPGQICDRYLPQAEELKKHLLCRVGPLPSGPQKMSDTEEHYLYDSILSYGDSDITIYETPEWAEIINTPNISDMKIRYYDCLRDLVDSKKGYEGQTLKDDARNGVRILYRHFPFLNSLLLIAPLKIGDKKAYDSYAHKYQKVLEGEISSEELLKLSRRSYPAFVLADESMWGLIQKNEVGNIALSPEESKILDDVSRKNGEKLFPLFINGRPGSGKSTILQYLFAEYLCMHLRKDATLRLPAPPLYLTYSEQLLNSAKKSIQTILKCNTKLALESFEVDSETLTHCFGVFHKFLHALLPAAVQGRFDFRNKIDFPHFRKLWDARRRTHPSSDVRKLSPELAWHVLRTYIKGMHYDSSDEFDADSYNELPREQKTVSQNTFEQIYQNVWEGWYKNYCTENRLWDDQDLVFAVLNEPGLDISQYPAIFCDEAQDFSKLELDLILRLSLYSQRSLPPQALKSIPFAFAGDPFQTLNPTGFEWGSLKANFHEKIVQGLDKSSHARLDFNDQELSYNYRSTKHIVGLCNLLQLLRGILFDLKDLKPQRTWFDADASMPVFFNIKDPLCEQKLREQTELVIILPCQEGEEEEYVSEDPFLKNLMDAGVSNFLSPMRAKGLEFSRVVLYKFGSKAHESYPELFSPLMTGKSHGGSMNTTLPLKYFMNRLYVGASRAKNRLIIVDDDKGIESLWDRDDLKSEEQLLGKYISKTLNEWTPDMINYVHSGRAESWSEDRDDPLKIAEDFRDSGRAERDPYKLKLAETNYMRANSPALAKLCRAERFELEDNYSAAGELYLELNQSDQALRCLWRAGRFELISKTAGFAQSMEHRAASFMMGEKSEIECDKFLQFLCDQLESDRKFKILTDASWIPVLDKTMEAVSNFACGSLKLSLFNKLKMLDMEGLSSSRKDSYAQLAFSVDDYKTALSIWESLPEATRKTKEYSKAKAYTAEYPDNLRWLREIGDNLEIIRQWRQHKERKVADNYAEILTNAMIEEDDRPSLVDLLDKYSVLESIRKFYALLKKKNDMELLEKIGLELMRGLIRENNWKEVVQIADDKALSKDIRNAFFIQITWAVAVGDDFNTATREQKEDISSLLKKVFINAPWENILPIRIVGAAIERGRKIIDSLEFYEAIWKTNKIQVDESEKTYALRRWVRCKMRYADYLEKDKGLKKEAGKTREEADSISSSRLNINKANIEEEPDLSTVHDQLEKYIAQVHTAGIPDVTRQGILELHGLGWSIEKIAASYRLDLRRVEAVIAQSQIDKH